MNLLLKRLTQADIAFYLLPLIMLNLVAGTLAQRWMGLYAAQKMFFGSFVFRAGPLPFPGGYTLTGLLTVFLLVKFLFESEWSLRKSGINLAHLGVLVLLGGGLLTSLFAREGYMIIPEGGATPYVYDYQKRSLYIFQNDLLLYDVPFGKIETSLQSLRLPFSISVKSTCVNCTIKKRSDAGEEAPAAPLHSMAKFMALESKPPEKEPEENLSGLTFVLSGAGPKTDGLYVGFENMPKPVAFNTGGNSYKIIFGREQRRLPFSLRLRDFTKETYPGTANPRAYRSDVVVLDHGLSWPARIEMNRPLRYKGYTFYQSSFTDAPGSEATVLSVVENKGRLFPYIGTALVALGLLLHLAFTIRERQAA